MSTIFLKEVASYMSARALSKIAEQHAAFIRGGETEEAEHGRQRA